MQKLHRRQGVEKTSRSIAAFARQLRREPRAARLIPALLAAGATLDERAAERDRLLQARVETTADVEHRVHDVEDGLRGVDIAWSSVTGRKPHAGTDRLFPLPLSEMLHKSRAGVRRHALDTARTLREDGTFAGIVEHADHLEAAVARLDEAEQKQAAAHEASEAARTNLTAALDVAVKAYNDTIVLLVAELRDAPGLAEQLVPRLDKAKRKGTEPAATEEADERPEAPPTSEGSSG